MKKTILISGASGGLGTELAKQALAAGYFVIGVSRKPIEVSHICDNKNFQMYTMTEYSSAKIECVINTIRADHQKIDRAILTQGSAFGLQDPRCVKNAPDVFDLNIISHMNFIDQLEKQKCETKSFCCIASIAGVENHGHPLYCASKAALIAYCRALGRKMAEDGQCLFCVSPGAFMSQGSYWSDVKIKNPKKYEDFLSNRLSVNEFPDVADVAQFILSLIEQSHPNFAGANFLYDGGQGKSW